MEIYKNKASEWFKNLRNKICNCFEEIEKNYSGNMTTLQPGKFQRKIWERPGGGGGEISIMRGRVFEKVGVNYSKVYGKLSPQFQNKIPGAAKDPTFWASGISIVAHMNSPHIPAAHMNTRFISTTENWFGGGIDLTPTFPEEKETSFFHNELKKICNTYNAKSYEKYSKWCDDYFFLPHRKEPRGVGGIFFDQLNCGNWEKDFSFVKEVGKGFKNIFPKIINNKLNNTWTDEEKRKQLIKRGRYVEFNLIHDRGTKFGLETDGNTEAILMSLPPHASWP
ncbi:MAG: oxygen-dependent coproporphyrinogen oxidase [Rhodospirillaceae bacterium]|nr:oxygen-dependent coproporphyrinogen oxidase [Rhodospirillaceae bacterium]|tara:strand:- start:1532 stop:2371 length:840 start_codon:yes stop_codon:yes gene_type:complete